MSKAIRARLVVLMVITALGLTACDLQSALNADGLAPPSLDDVEVPVGDGEPAGEEAAEEPAVPAPAPAQPVADPAPAPAPSAPSGLSDIEAEIFRLANEERRSRGLPPFEHRDLDARAWSAEMRRTNTMRHDNLNNFWPRSECNTVGENVAAGQRSAQQVMNAWMNSAGHRRNILSPDFNRLDVGVDGTFYTQRFAGCR